ncbi:HD domain-containing protein [Dehalogenimonas sp. 4OHTPN]|uniref:HD domain-containing protein n=1 Tax=Dehalogenimonas sp. 4OHTPN TaxID=3166643 RepID=A0AAU8GC08_9CHLR
MTEPRKPFLPVNNPGRRCIIEAAAATASTLDMPAYIVGGYLRDTLLGRPANDLDLVVEGDAGKMAAALAAALGTEFFALDAAAGIYRIPLKQAVFEEIDISSAAGAIRDDLARRDFTVDALAAAVPFPLPEQLVITDEADGLADLEQKVLRAVSTGVFRDDPARLLRGVRLAGELGFAIEPGTERLITAAASLAASVAGERTREDLIKVLSLPSIGQTVEYLDRLGLLAALFPELETCRGVEQPPEHAWDVLDHQLKTVGALDWVLRRGLWPHARAGARQLIPWDVESEAYFLGKIGGSATRLALTRLAALIHDVAKPETRTLAANGRLRFYGHARKGAEKADTIMKRLRFSQREAGFVTAIVEAHLRPTQLGPEAIPPTPRAVYRFLRDTGDAAVATLYLSLADHLAARGPDLDLDNFRQHVTIVGYVLAERGRQLAKPSGRLVDGNELQARFGMKPGPAMGRILEAVAEARATGEIASKEEALTMAERLIREPPADDQKNLRRGRQG